LFSDNIWQNQKELQEGLENALRRSILRGENPRKTGAQLRKLVKKEFELKKFAANRIAITETAGFKVRQPRSRLKTMILRNICGLQNLELAKSVFLWTEKCSKLKTWEVQRQLFHNTHFAIVRFRVTSIEKHGMKT